MDFKKIDDSSRIPVLGLGTWEMGGRYEADKKDKQKWVKLIRDAIELGITHIDTAEVYGNGFTEQIIGEAIQPFERKKIFLASKAWTSRLNYGDIMGAFDSSLKRLKTDYLDLYMIHKPSEKMNLKEMMEALEYLNNNKLVKIIGLSNFNVNQINEAVQFLSNCKIGAVQNEYNLINRDDKVYNFCLNNNMIFIAYRPLLKGKLIKTEISVLDAFVKKYDRTKAQIALNWLLSKKQMVAIPKCSSKEHLIENLGSIGWKMDKEDYAALDRLNC